MAKKKNLATGGKKDYSGGIFAGKKRSFAFWRLHDWGKIIYWQEITLAYTLPPSPIANNCFHKNVLLCTLNLTRGRTIHFGPQSLHEMLGLLKAFLALQLTVFKMLYHRFQGPFFKLNYFGGGGAGKKELATLLHYSRWSKAMHLQCKLRGRPFNVWEGYGFSPRDKLFFSISSTTNNFFFFTAWRKQSFLF